VRALPAQVARFVAAVLITSGILLLVDAAVTVAWQEPISALIADREQADLRGQLKLLERLSASDQRALTSLRDDTPRQLAALAAKASGRARSGHALGRLQMPTLRRSYVFVQGTSGGSLRRGPGHYSGTPLPGEPGTVAIAGHRTTYLAPFRTIDQLQPGDPLVLEMPYGVFTYRVQETRIVKPSAVWVTRSTGYPRLVLTACHPLYSAANRIVVFAKLSKEESRDSSRRTSPTSSASDTSSTASQ
jgi:sortase A